MTEFLQNFHFLRPWFLLFLFIPFALIFKTFKTGAKTSSWEEICDKNLLKFLLVNKSDEKKISIKGFIFVGLFSAIIAGAGPSWMKKEVKTLDIENPVMFVQSLAQDMSLTDIKPSRLERAKFFILDVTDNLKHGQFGMEVYSGEPFVITPITDDIRLIKNILPQIVPNIVPENGDRPDRAIKLAVEKFQNAGYTYGNIVMMSSDVGQRFDLAINAAQNAAKNKFYVHIIDTSFDGNEKLKILAQKGQGIYTRVTNPNLDILFNRINDDTNKRMMINKNLQEKYMDFGYFLLIIPLICLSVFFRKGLLILVFCLFSTSAYAGLFKNNNQEAFSEFQKKNYDKAYQMFYDRFWKGISLYKMDKYEDAFKEFDTQKTADGYYNKGVTLTKLCKYKEAFEAFNQSLEIDNTNPDALFNRNVLKELFEKAKTNPEVLECEKPKQKQNKNNNESKDNNKNKDKNQENGQNQQQGKDKQPDKNQSQKDGNDNQQQESQQSSGNSQQNNQTEQPQDSKSGENKPSEDKSQDTNQDSENKEDKNTPDKANSDGGKENKSQNKEGNDKGGSEKQNVQAPVNLVKTKKGKDDDKYDDEALIMQHQYRKIPEDVGGLLRQFIRKEYLKGRYNNENM